MRQFDEADSTLISIVLEAVGKIDAILVDSKEGQSTVPDRFVEALVSISEELREGINGARPNSRGADLATIAEHGGFNDERTALVIYLLFGEFGPDLLSDTGLRRLADCMRPPGAA